MGMTQNLLWGPEAMRWEMTLLAVERVMRAPPKNSPGASCSVAELIIHFAERNRRISRITRSS